MWTALCLGLALMLDVFEFVAFLEYASDSRNPKFNGLVMTSVKSIWLYKYDYSLKFEAL